MGFSPGQPGVSETFEIVVQVNHCRLQFDKFLVNIHRIFSDNIMGLKLLILAQISVLIYNYNVAMANFSTVPKCHASCERYLSSIILINNKMVYSFFDTSAYTQHITVALLWHNCSVFRV